MAVAEGDGEGYEVAANYGSDAQRWFAHYRAEDLSARLGAAGFAVVSVRRWGLHRDWLGVRARREAEVPNVTN